MFCPPLAWVTVMFWREPPDQMVMLPVRSAPWFSPTVTVMVAFLPTGLVGVTLIQLSLE